jgi:hypothetical protein
VFTQVKEERMFTAFSVDTRRSDLAEQKRLHQEQLRTRLRRLRRRVRHAASVQRERALIYRLLAGRFALDSPHHLLLRMLARSAMRRMRRLEALLHELSGTATSGLPRRWLFAWKYWYARQAPRKWALLLLTYQKSENEIEDTRKNLPPLRVFPTGSYDF